MLRRGNFFKCAEGLQVERPRTVTAMSFMDINWELETVRLAKHLTSNCVAYITVCSDV
jgi:hypothetical protein